MSGTDPQFIELNCIFLSLTLIILGLNWYAYDLISIKLGKCWDVGFSSSLPTEMVIT